MGQGNYAFVYSLYKYLLSILCQQEKDKAPAPI